MVDEKIESLREGERFTYAGYDWITLDPHYCADGVLAIMADSYHDGCDTEHRFDENGYNNYKNSSLHRKLICELLPKLDEDNLMIHTVDLTADNGDERYGTVTDKVFILSCDEYRTYRNYIPLIDECMWTCTPWYIDPYTGYGDSVLTVLADGYVVGNGAYNTRGVLPACIFKSSNLKLRRQAQVVER